MRPSKWFKRHSTDRDLTMPSGAEGPRPWVALAPAERRSVDPAPPTPPGPEDSKGPIDNLAVLADLRERGILTEAEFKTQKSSILTLQISRARQKPLFSLGVAAAAVAGVIAFASLITPTTPSNANTAPASATTYPETAGGVAHTWTNYTNAGGTEGPNVASNQTIQIACVVSGFRVADGDTSWYQIASSPWNNGYYVSADAFYNNGQTSGSLQGTPFVDPAVPACGASSPPPAAAAPSPSPVSSSSGTHAETTGGVAHTWTNYTNAGGTEGPNIASNQTVQISCVVQGFKVADGDTSWYQIASSPWNNGYYVSADAFYNNGQTSGSLQGTPFVDPAVPMCGGSSTPVGASPPVSTAPAPTPVQSAPTSGGPLFPVMNTSETLPDGVYFRNSPHTADTSRITGLGVYKGEQVQLNCYAFGDAVGPYNDTLWYYVHNVTRPTVNGNTDAGYLNAHYINDGKGANQIDAGVPACNGSTLPTSGSPQPPPPTAIVASAPGPAPAGTSISVSGTVRCDNGNPVEGVWVQATGGGWAAWKVVDREEYPSGSMAYYYRQVTSPTTISLHVGCGGSTATWRSSNYTPTTVMINSGRSLNTSCNEVLGATPAVRCGALSPPTIGNRVADLALTYEGQWGGVACEGAHLGTNGYVAGYSGGQCRQFVNCLVYRASGHAYNPTSPDYSFTGATAISGSSATRGDLIQQGIGVHTAIILRNLGGGSYLVVDSNSGLPNNNEVVHVHDWTPGTNGVSYWRYTQTSSDQTGAL